MVTLNHTIVGTHYHTHLDIDNWMSRKIGRNYIDHHADQYNLKHLLFAVHARIPMHGKIHANACFFAR